METTEDTQTTPIRVPRVGPIGVVHYPEGYEARSQRFSAGRRLAALALLVVFTVATVGTTAYTLGAYCLTTWGGTPF